jgi:hypothetical protein
MTLSTYKGFGVAPGLDARLKAKGDRINRFVNASFSRAASTPDGYDVKGTVPAILAGGMSALRVIATYEASGNLLQGAPISGTVGVVEMTGESGLSLVVGMEGAAAVATLAGDNLVLKLTIGLDGLCTVALTGDGNILAMIVPFDGIGNVAQVSGTSDLRGLLSMAGEWTPFTDLSPQGLAAAVWEHVISGTEAQDLLAAAGAAGDPLLGVVEDGKTMREVLRIMAAVLAGKVSGAGTGIETFVGLDGTTARVVSTVDTSGNRTAVVVNGA